MGRFSIEHLSAAIHLRASLYKEVLKAKSEKRKLPKHIFKTVMQKPDIYEEYIWLLRFIPNDEKVTLIDIGGHSGYWAEYFIEYYPKTVVYAFEPVKEMYDKYVERFKFNENITIYNTAIGKTEEKRTINVARGYGLTSFNSYDNDLEELNIHFDRKEEVKIDKLNNYYSKIDFHNTIIKVDVQGFETNVVLGGLDVFKMAELAIIECSFINEYKNQLPTFGDLVSILREVGLHPIRFGVFDKTRGPIAFERNVLFVKEKYFSKIWDT